MLRAELEEDASSIRRVADTLIATQQGCGGGGDGGDCGDRRAHLELLVLCAEAALARPGAATAAADFDAADACLRRFFALERLLTTPQDAAGSSGSGSGSGGSSSAAANGKQQANEAAASGGNKQQQQQQQQQDTAVAAAVPDQFRARALLAAGRLVALRARAAALKGAPLFAATLEAVRRILEGAELASAGGARLAFLVHNASVELDRAARPLQRDGARRLLLQAQGRVCQLLEAAAAAAASAATDTGAGGGGDQGHNGGGDGSGHSSAAVAPPEWRARQLVALALCAADAGRADEASKALARAQELAAKHSLASKVRGATVVERAAATCSPLSPTLGHQPLLTTSPASTPSPSSQNPLRGTQRDIANLSVHLAATAGTGAGAAPGKPAAAAAGGKAAGSIGAMTAGAATTAAAAGKAAGGKAPAASAAAAAPGAPKQQQQPPAPPRASPADADGALAAIQWALSTRPEPAVAAQQIREAWARLDPDPSGPAAGVDLAAVARAAWAAAVCRAPPALTEAAAARATAAREPGPRAWAALARAAVALEAAAMPEGAPPPQGGASDPPDVRAAVEARAAILNTLEELAAAFARLGDGAGATYAAKLAWNAALPLLQPATRRRAQRALAAAARALEAVAAPAPRLRAPLHLELARCEAADDALLRVSAHNTFVGERSRERSHEGAHYSPIRPCLALNKLLSCLLSCLLPG